MFTLSAASAEALLFTFSLDSESLGSDAINTLINIKFHGLPTLDSIIH